MSALDIQIGGEHYKNAKIQPVQYIEANGLGFLEGCVVKRITRHDKPTGKGRQDIEKAIHELQLLLEFRYPEQTMDALSYGTALHQSMTARTNPPVEDIYAEFAARTKALPKNPNAKMRLCCMSFDDRPHDYQCSADIHVGKQPECPECGYPTDAAGTHYATCSQLTAPEEYKVEAQVAFDEAAEISEALARKVSAGKIDTDFDECTPESETLRACEFCGAGEFSWHRPDCHFLRRGKSVLGQTLARKVSAGKIDTDFDWDGAVAEEEALIEAEEEPAAKNPSIIDDYEEWHCLVCGAVHTRIGHTHQRIGFNPCNPWCPEPVRPEEPAAAMDDDSPRMQAIGQNGNDGEHYEDPWAGAPEWAKYKAQDADGEWYWYEVLVSPLYAEWVETVGHHGRVEFVDVDGEPNPNWRDTLITRT